MTIVKFNTHLTSDPFYSDQGVSFNVIFGEKPIHCFTNRVDMMSHLARIKLSVGDSIELTATLLTIEKDGGVEINLKVMAIEMLGSHYLYRKRKRGDIEELPRPMASIKRTRKHTPQPYDDMSLCSDGKNQPGTSSSSDVSMVHIQEFEGSFMEFFNMLQQKVARHQSSVLTLDSLTKEHLQDISGHLERLWYIHSAMQKLTGDDELAVIVRFVDCVRYVTHCINNLVPRFSENGDDGLMLNAVFLPSYIYSKFMSNQINNNSNR